MLKNMWIPADFAGCAAIFAPSARARALGLSLVNRGALGLEEVIDNLYECACCGACTKECVTGWDPVLFVKQARLECALDGVLPDYIEKLVNNCIERQNAYGVLELDEALKDAIAAHAQKTGTLLFLGVDARCRVPNAARDAIRLLEKAGVVFTVLDEEPPSGQQMDYLIGRAEETKGQMENCAKTLNAFENVVVYDPQDAKVFKREYKELGIALSCGVETFPTFLAGLLDQGVLKGSNEKIAAVYQDPFELSRDLGETDAPRKVVSAYARYSEMLMHGKDTMWAGNLLMREWMPDVMKDVARMRIQNAKGVGAAAIVTASVSEYASLKAAADPDMQILSLEELILAAEEKNTPVSGTDGGTVYAGQPE